MCARLCRMLLLLMVLCAAVADASTHTHTARTLDTSGTVILPLAGCWQTGFSVRVRVGAESFALQLDTTSTALAIATPSCLDCVHVSPRYAPGTDARRVGDVTERWTYADGSGWRADAFVDSVNLESSTGTALLPHPLCTPVAAIREVTPANGYFFPLGSCDDLGRSAASYQGILGIGPPRNGGIGMSGEMTSLWERMQEEFPSMPRIFNLQLCERGGSLSFGAGLASSAGHAEFLAGYAGRMRYTSLISAHEGVYALNVSSLRVSSSAWTATVEPEPILFAGRNIRTVIDTTSLWWQLPSTIFVTLTAQINSHPLFARLFFGTAFWDRSECVPLPEGTSLESLTALPRIAMRMQNGLVLNMSAVGSYIIPCDPARNTWGPGLRPSIPGSNNMLLGWSFLNQFLVQIDSGANLVGFATTDSQAACQDATGWNGRGTSGANVTGGIAGVCGTGGTSDLEAQGDCVAPRPTSPTASSCLAVSAASPPPGAAAGSCGESTAAGSFCSLACAAGYTASLSRPFVCTPAGAGAQLLHGAQGCMPLQWMQPNISRASQLQPGERVNVQWQLPINGATFWSGAPHAFAVRLLSQSSNYSVTLLDSAAYVAPAGLVDAIDLQLPNEAGVYVLQASLDGRAWGTELTLLVSSGQAAWRSLCPGAPEPSTPVVPVGEVSSTGSADGSTDGVPADNDSSAASSTAAAAPSYPSADSSSTGSSLSPTLSESGVLVLLDTSLSYTDMLLSPGGEGAFRAQLLQELETNVQIHAQRIGENSLRVMRSLLGNDKLQAEFVLLPVSVKESAGEPSIAELVVRLQALAATPAAERPQGTFSASLVGVSTTQLELCADYQWRRDCNPKPSSPATELQNDSWMPFWYGLMAGALLATTVLVVWCIWRTRCSGPSAGAHAKLQQVDTNDVGEGVELGGRAPKQSGRVIDTVAPPSSSSLPDRFSIGERGEDDEALFDEQLEQDELALDDHTMQTQRVPTEEPEEPTIAEPGAASRRDEKSPGREGRTVGAGKAVASPLSPLRDLEKQSLRSSPPMLDPPSRIERSHVTIAPEEDDEDDEIDVEEGLNEL